LLVDEFFCIEIENVEIDLYRYQITPSKYLQLEDIYEQKKRSQRKLNLPPNSIMKYEKHHMVPIMDIV
jgi:hypothetical protein